MRRTLVPILVALCAPGAAQAATLAAPGPYGSVQGAIDASAPGDTVVLAGGTTDEVLAIPHDLSIEGDATTRSLIAPGPANAIGAAAAIYVAEGAAVSLSGLDVRGGATRGLYADAGSHLVLLDVALSDSGTSGDGGGAWVDGDLDATDLTVDNTLATYGGGLWVSGNLTCHGCRFVRTVADQLGGAVYHTGSELELTDVELVATAGSLVDGIYTDSTGSELTRVRGCGLSGLFWGYGGGTLRNVGLVGEGGTGVSMYLFAYPGQAWNIDHGTFIDTGYPMILYDVRQIPPPDSATTADTGGLWTLYDTGAPAGEVQITNSLFLDNLSLLIPVYGEPILLLPTLSYNAYDNPFDASVDPGVGSLLDVSVELVGAPDLESDLCPLEAFMPTFDAPTLDAGLGTDPDGSPADIGLTGGPDAWPELHIDSDADGFTAVQECNDASALSYPGQPEVCDGLDNDCDGIVDLDAAYIPTWFLDSDGDGFGDGAAPAGTGTTQCEAPAEIDIGGTLVGWAPNGTDCDDADPAVHPDAEEDCDTATDLNCDGSVDAGASDGLLFWPDADGDDYGDGTAVPVRSCTSPGPGFTSSNGDDCNDGLGSIHPGADDLCNNIDENCSGDESDASDATLWFPDADGDGAPAASGGITSCESPQVAGVTYVPEGSADVDCDDQEAGAVPGGIEVCDGLDNDCSGTADDLTALPPTWHADDDGDGFGNSDPRATISTDCPVDGYVSNDDDCNDADPQVAPGAPEVCNGRDDDCSGVVDDGPLQTAYIDGDGDGYGGEAVQTPCPSPDLVFEGGDCQDAYADVNPGAEEVPGNDVDEDCQGGPADPPSGPRGEPAATGCTCAQGASGLGPGWIGLLALALVARRRGAAAVGLALVACAPEPASDRLPEVPTRFASLAEATQQAPHFAVPGPDGPMLLQSSSRATVRPSGELHLHHRGVGERSAEGTMALTHWGRDRLQPVPAAAPPEALGPRVVLERGELVEWYLNGPRGLEQGFTVRERPSGRGPLRLGLSVHGLAVTGSSTALTFSDLHGVARWRYDKLVVVDRDDAPVPASLVSSCDAPLDCTVALVIDDDNARYPLYVDPLLSEFVTDVQAVDAQANLGASLSINGDRAVVGAPGPANEGRVFILERNEGNPNAWAIEKTLFSGTLSSFGTTVSLDDPYLVVGAPDDDTIAIYVHDGDWVEFQPPIVGDEGFGAAIDLQMPYLLVGAPDANGGDGALSLGAQNIDGSEFTIVPLPMSEPGARLGATVALRQPSLVVGAPAYLGDQGVVIVYGADGSETQRLIGDPGDELGSVMAASSARLALGIPSQGAVAVFDLSTDATSKFEPAVDPRIEAPGVSEGGFGASVAVVNDTLLVGDAGTTAYAHQYAYEDGTTWLHTQSLPVATDNDGTPITVALSSRTLVTGAPGAGTVGTTSVWDRNSDGIVESTVFDTDDGVLLRAGRAVAIDGDLAVVGDPEADTPLGGRVDVYENDGAGWALAQALLPTTSSGGLAEFGHGVALDGNTVVAGAPGVGEAYLYTRDGSWVEERLIDPDGDADTRFGEAVAIDGNLLVVGDPSGRGRAQVYLLDEFLQAGVVDDTILTDPDGFAGGSTIQLGASVAVEANRIALGAPGWDGAGGVTDAGAVEVHEFRVFSALPPELLQRIEGTSADDRCGASVALDADRLAIGCPNNGPALLPGRAELYRGDASSYILEAEDVGTTQEARFGSSVAIQDDRWFVGAEGLSRVRINQRNTGGEDQWGEAGVIDGPNATNFGKSMDVDGNTVIVGAPKISPGSVHLFVLDGVIPPTLFDDAVVLDEDDVDVLLPLLDNDILAGATLGASDAITINGPSDGTLTRDGDLLLFTPDANANGLQTFEYTLPGSLTYATVTLDVQSINDLPVALDDAFDAFEETLLSASTVLANDTDVETAQLTALLVTGPSNAESFALSPDGTFTYVGELDFFGSDSFTYQAADTDGGLSAPATVQIEVTDTPEAPVLSPSSWTTDQDTPLQVTAPGLADPAYAELPADTRFRVADATSLDGVVLVFANGGFTYTPTPGFVGTTQFQVVAETAGGSDTTSVSVEVLDTNQPPVPQPDTFTVQEDRTLTVSLNGVLSNDADADGDALQATFTAPTLGTLVATDPDGTFTYAPAPDAHGEATFTYTVTDGQLEIGPVLVTIDVTPVNDAPTALDDAYEVEGPGPHLFEAPEGLLANDSDVDGDGLLARLLRPPDEAEVEVDGDGSFVFTPRLGVEGELSLDYVATDGVASTPAEVRILVVGNGLPIDTADTARNDPTDTGDGCDDAWYPDRDGDGFAEATEARLACQAPEGFTDQVGDCDDTRADRYPGAPEIQGDGIDQDCDGSDADLAPAGACATGLGTPGGAGGAALVLLLLLPWRRREVR